MTAILKKIRTGNEQKIWSVIRIMCTSLDAPMIALATDIDRETVRRFLNKLCRTDVIICTTPARKAGGFAIYRLPFDPGPYTPGSEAARLWQAAKTIRRRSPRLRETRAERAARLARHVAFLALDRARDRASEMMRASR